MSRDIWLKVPEVDFPLIRRGKEFRLERPCADDGDPQMFDAWCAENLPNRVAVGKTSNGLIALHWLMYETDGGWWAWHENAYCFQDANEATIFKLFYGGE